VTNQRVPVIEKGGALTDYLEITPNELK
jgi:hypothetical protein